MDIDSKDGIGPLDLEAAGLHRVLMSVDAMGGVWTYALELVEGLARLGVRVTLLAMGGAPTPAQREAAEHVPGVELLESRFKLEWMNDPWPDVLAAGEWMLEVEERVRPDVVHLNGYVHAALPWRAPVLVAAHSCVCSWFAAVRGEPAPPEWDAYREEVARGLGQATRVVAPSSFMLQALREHYGFRGLGSVIHNGRSAAALAPRSKEPFIFAAARLWDEAKNIAALDEAARDLPWPVFVAGDPRGPDGSGVRFEHLIHVGQLAPGEVADWMNRAMVYALPALYEPFGMTPLEAALAGCALVLGDIPSLREVWGKAACYVPPRSPRALATALDRVMSDATLRLQYARRARERAARLTAGRMVQEYLSVYLDMLGVRASSPALRNAE